MEFPEMDNSEAMSQGIQELRKPMKEVRAWKLLNGHIYENKLEAVLAVLSSKQSNEFQQALAGSEGRFAEIAEAVCWLADEIRKTRKRKKEKSK